MEMTCCMIFLLELVIIFTHFYYIYIYICSAPLLQAENDVGSHWLASTAPYPLCTYLYRAPSAEPQLIHGQVGPAIRCDDMRRGSIYYGAYIRVRT